MPTYLSPGVYVEEISSGSAPIAGVGTSVAAFIGVITEDDIMDGIETQTGYYHSHEVTGEKVGSGDGLEKSFELKN